MTDNARLAVLPAFVEDFASNAEQERTRFATIVHGVPTVIVHVANVQITMTAEDAERLVVRLRKLVALSRSTGSR